MRSAFLFVAFLLGACATPPPPQITGPYATSLTTRDVQQITRLVATRPELGPTIRKLEAVRRGRVRVEAGRARGPKSWSGSSFFVVRRDNTWYIDGDSPSEAITERTISVH